MFARSSSVIIGESGVTFTSQWLHLLPLLYFFVTGCQTDTLRLLIGVATVDNAVAGLCAGGNLPSSLFIVVMTQLHIRISGGNVGWGPPPWPPFNQCQETHGHQAL